MKNVLKPLAKSYLIPSGLKSAASATDSANLEKTFWSIRPSDLASRMTTLIVSTEKKSDIMKKDKSLEKSGLLIKIVSKTVKYDTK